MNTELSILIPSYNYDCSTLIRAVSQQLKMGDELLVADDGSTDEAKKEQNRKACEEVNARFIDLGRNIGRSAIRNLLAREAKGTWLLFMDNDAAIKDEQFVERYRRHQADADVLCGGTQSPAQCPSVEVSLRWRYESDYWSRHNATVRAKFPYKSFTTFNFCIRREVFLSILFREDIAKYGHEDTLFGEDLKRKEIRLLHIENPLLHLGLDTNAAYLRKVELALDNLYEQRSQLSNAYAIISVSQRVRRWHLATAVSLFYKTFRPLLRSNLLGHHPCLRILQFYKLGYFLSKEKR